jgi:hypothetical protein
LSFDSVYRKKVMIDTLRPVHTIVPDGHIIGLADHHLACTFMDPPFVHRAPWAMEDEPLAVAERLTLVAFDIWGVGVESDRFHRRS